MNISTKTAEIIQEKDENLEKKFRGQFGVDQCEKVEKIFFLKTSKTGSTTVANILMRFGFRRENSNFLLGELNNGLVLKIESSKLSSKFYYQLKRALFFVNGYMPFRIEACWLGRNIKPTPIFDISYVHMRYNKTAVDKLMHPKTKKISILREPKTNFISSWKYYRHGLI